MKLCLVCLWVSRVSSLTTNGSSSVNNRRGSFAADASAAFMVVSGITAKQEFCISSDGGVCLLFIFAFGFLPVCLIGVASISMQAQALLWRLVLVPLRLAMGGSCSIYKVVARFCMLLEVNAWLSQAWPKVATLFWMVAMEPRNGK